MMSPRERYALAAIIAAFIIGGGIILTVPREPPEDEAEVTIPEEPELEGTVRIGVVVSSEEEMPAYELLVPLAQGDINEYCMDEGLNCSFEFEIASGEGMGATALQRTQDFKAQGIDLVMGYGWSSHLCVTISYVKFNGMVQLSPASTSPVCSEDDSTFRLCPHDFKTSLPMTRMVQSRNISAVVVLHRGDAWGDGLLEGFREEFNSVGGKLTASIRYASETSGDGFRSYVMMVNAAISGSVEEVGADQVAMVVYSFDEVIDILQVASDYPELMSVTWFGAEANLGSKAWLTYTIPESVMDEAETVSLISPFPACADTPLYERLNEAYMTEFGRSLDFYNANIYDCCWILALSAIEAGTDDGDVVRNVLPEVAADYSGLSGLCVLDENGDRDAVDYAVWGYFEVDGTCKNLRCGTYRYDSDSVEWDETLLKRVEAEE
jgi:branched-chain amino acid transport system substrate-binding protein